MATYKHKYTQVVISSSGQPMYHLQDGVVLFNLNSCFTKKTSFAKFISTLKESLELSRVVNFCNLASLCYRLKIKYNSDECLDFMKKVIDIVKSDYPCVILTQSEFDNFGEIDLRPIDTLVKVDKTNNSIYVNNVLLNALSLIGYSNNQLYDVLDYTTDFSNVLPIDVIKSLPLKTTETMEQYENIKQYLIGE